MAPRTVWANLNDGLQPFSLLDQSLADMGLLGIIPCSATGANALVLTPLASVAAPNVTSYANRLTFSFIAPATATGPVTISVAGLGALNAYTDGSTQAGSNAVILNSYYQATYSSSLNGGAGGFYLAGVGASILPLNNVWTGTNTFNPVSGNAITVNPAANTTNKGVVVTHTGPTSGSQAGQVNYNSFSVDHRNAVTSSGGDPLSTSVASALKATITAAGNAAGFMIGGFFRVNHNVSATTNAFGDLIALASQAYSNQIENSVNSGLYGKSSIAYLDTTGSHDHVAGDNSEVTTLVGATFSYRVAYRAQSSDSTKQGTTSDAAFSVVSNGASDLGFKTGINFGEFGNAQSISATGSLFKSQQAMTVANVFNMANVTVTGNILNFPNVQMTGAGHIGLGTAPTGDVIAAVLSSTVSSGVNLQNTNTGGVASFLSANDAGNFGDFGVRGTLRASYGALLATEAYAYSNTNLVLMADNATGVIKFAAKGNALKGQFGTGLAVGSAAADPGADGVVNATTGYRVANAAATGNVLRGNGTTFVSSTLADTDLSGTAWSAYTPTVTSNTGTITTLGAVSGRSKTIGKTVFFQVVANITTNGTGATYLNFTLPSTPSGFDFFAVGQDLGIGPMVIGHVVASSANMAVTLTTGAYPAVNGSRIILSGTYEAA